MGAIWDSNTNNPGHFLYGDEAGNKLQTVITATLQENQTCAHPRVDRMHASVACAPGQGQVTTRSRSHEFCKREHIQTGFSTSQHLVKINAVIR